MSNSLGNMKLNFDNIVGLVLNENVQKKANKETSSIALNVESIGRSFDRNSSRS